MPNKKLANEWLGFAGKSLETAKLLNEHNHYTDVIAVEIQQSVEKAFKAVYALLVKKSQEPIHWKFYSIIFLKR